MTALFEISRLPTRWNRISMAGSDAADFLQRLSTANVNALQPGMGSEALFLNPQGKILAYFMLWRTDENSFLFEFDAGKDQHFKTELLAAIEQYTFAERFEVVDHSADQLACTWIFPSAESTGSDPLKPGHTSESESGLRVFHHGSQQFGRPWLSVWGRPEKLSSWISTNFSEATTLSFDELESWRISSLGPRADHEITGKLNPLEAGLARAVAPNKGCYPGQEVIEKIIALGAPAKRLCLIEGELTSAQTSAELNRGMKLQTEANPPQEMGELTSASISGKTFHALAILKKIHAKEGLPSVFPGNGRGVVKKVSSYQL